MLQGVLAEKSEAFAQTHASTGGCAVQPAPNHRPNRGRSRAGEKLEHAKERPGKGDWVRGM